MAQIDDLPPDDFALIALAEFLSILCFLIVRASVYANKIIAYAGDNQNVVGWIKSRRPKNRISQYFSRILNRVETEHNCAVSPCYISSGNNVFCGEISRLPPDLSRNYGCDAGFSFVDVLTTPQWYLTDRIQSLSLFLPTDPSDRVMRIMQFVEKRPVRSIPSQVKQCCKIALFGSGTNSWRAASEAMALQGFSHPMVVSWPSETGGEEWGKPSDFHGYHCFVFFTVCFGRRGVRYKRDHEYTSQFGSL